jgi:uncharacterized membrane protein
MLMIPCGIGIPSAPASLSNGSAAALDASGRDWKGKLSPVFYLTAIALAFVSPWIASGLYVFVALMWLVPDAASSAHR